MPEHVLPIVDVRVVPDLGDILGVMRRRARLVARLTVVEDRARAAREGSITWLDLVVGCFSREEIENDAERLRRAIRDCGDEVRRIKASAAAASAALRGNMGSAGGAGAAGMPQHQRACAAFVTFEWQRDARAFAALFRGAPPGLDCLERPRPHLLLRGERVRVLPAPEPGSVLWTNLAVTRSQRCARIALSTVASGALLLASFALVFAAAAQAQAFASLSAPYDCGAQPLRAFVRGWLSLHTAADEAALRAGTLAGAGAAQAFCVCETLPWGDMASAADVQASPWLALCAQQACDRLFALAPAAMYAQPQCARLAAAETESATLTGVASLAIILVNAALEAALRAAAAFEGHASVEALNRSLAPRLLLAQFFNTAVLTVLVNVAWPASARVPGAGAVVGGFGDVSGSWFASVGVQIMTTMLVLIASPHALPLARALLRRWQWARLLASGGRRGCASCTCGGVFGRSLLARLSEGEAMDVSVRLAAALNTVLVCYTFATGMPLLNLVAAATFAVAYWADKWLFVTHLRAPPLESSAGVAAMLDVVPVALALHFGVGAWMLGSLDAAAPAAVAGAGAGPQGAVSLTSANDADTRPGVVSLFFDSGGLAFHVNGLRLGSVAALYSYLANTTAAAAPQGSVAAAVAPASLARVQSPAAAPLFACFVAVVVALAAALVLRVLCASTRGLRRLVPITLRKGQEKEEEEAEEEEEEFDDDISGGGSSGDGGSEEGAEAFAESEATRMRLRVPTPVYSVAASAGARLTALELVGLPSYDMLANPAVREELQIDAAAAAAAGRRGTYRPRLSRAHTRNLTPPPPPPLSFARPIPRARSAHLTSTSYSRRCSPRQIGIV